MTNNHPELLGVETKLRQLVDKLNLAMRDGTLLEVEEWFAAIEVESREARYTATRLMAGKP